MKYLVSLLIVFCLLFSTTNAMAKRGKFVWGYTPEQQAVLDNDPGGQGRFEISEVVSAGVYIPVEGMDNIPSDQREIIQELVLTGCKTFVIRARTSQANSLYSDPIIGCPDDQTVIVPIERPAKIIFTLEVLPDE